MTHGTARNDILQAIRAAKPQPVARPDVDVMVPRVGETPDAVIARYPDAARGAGASVVETRRAAVTALCEEIAPRSQHIVSLVHDVAGTRSMPADPEGLAEIELLVCEADFGVAENGAVWLPGSRLDQRAAVFLATHVLVLLRRDAIVADLHEAYARLTLRDEAFGVFVAGPSKTADIEQSLVVGAHGPKAFTIALLSDG